MLRRTLNSRLTNHLQNFSNIKSTGIGHLMVQGGLLPPCRQLCGSDARSSGTTWGRSFSLFILGENH